MRVAKIQHNTCSVHFKKRHNTSCIGTHKACFPIFFGTIVSFHCLALIWLYLLPHFFLLLCWAMVESLLAFYILKMFYLCPLYAFYTFSKGWKMNIHEWTPSMMMLTMMLDMILTMMLVMSFDNDTTLFLFLSLDTHVGWLPFFFGVAWLIFSSLIFIISFILSKTLNVVRIKQWVDLQ